MFYFFLEHILKFYKPLQLIKTKHVVITGNNFFSCQVTIIEIAV